MLSVGEILKKEREKQGLTLKQIEKQIRIREKFLSAIEDNDWDFFSSKIYITGVLKNYSVLLNLKTEKILAFFRRDYEKKEDLKFKRRVSSKYLTPETKRLALTGLVLIFVLFFSYFGYQLKQYFSPPKVIITSPTTDKFTREDRITIIGKTEKEVLINIFKNRIYQDENGVFKYDFPLHDGKNELVIEVTGANGKKTILKKTYYNDLH